MSTTAFALRSARNEAPASSPAPRRSSSPPPSYGRTMRVVGREHELAQIERWFERGARSVTLVGPPGIGKTALALAYAARTEIDGVLRLDLGSARSEGEARELVARALELSSIARGFQQALHVAFEARQPRVVILDDVEHVRETASAVARVALRASEARILVTSRIALGEEEEAVVEVGPLSTECGAGAAASPAASMLLLRAAQWRMPEDWTADERASIERIAATVEGVPLALEIVAGRLRALDVPAVAAWFDNPAGVLASADPTRGERHASIENALAWSWDLLSAEERSDLYAAATFAGTFDLDAAVAVLETGARPALARLMSLRDKHLLQIGGRGDDGSIRFSLFAVTRAFVRSRRAEVVEADAADARHAEHFLARARALPLAWTYTLESAGGAHAFADVLDAVDRAFERADLCIPAVLDELLAALAGLAGMAVDGATIPLAVRRFERAAPIVTMASADARARFWLAWGTLKRIAGESPEAERCIEAAREAAQSRDLALLADVVLGAVLIKMGRTQEAEEALAKTLDGPESLLRAEALRLLAAARAVEGRTKEAELLAREAFRADVALETTPRAAFVILLGALLSENGRYAEARAQLEAARVGFLQANRPRWAALCDVNLASSALDEGRYPLALERYQAAYEAQAAMGDAFEAALASGYWGAALLLAGNPELATEKLERAVELAERTAMNERSRFFRGLLAVAIASERTNAAAERALGLLSRLGDGEEEQLLRDAVNVLLAARDEKPLALRRAGGSVARATSLPGSNFVRRLAVRVLESTVRDEARREERVLRMAKDASWFETYRGKTDLTTRLSLRRILIALAENAEKSPGALLTAHELIAAGWPGERILPAAARGRLRVAMCTLRKMGLRDYIASSRHGHALETRVEIVA